ncbi:MAG TPA: MauE/DoxX family redox-associated membrane protein [Streptosporangiaceae bacterium]|nr:MauE/DoxX family redox-associated membrane protein [Streptosporangiaceae bacterium]
MLTVALGCKALIAVLLLVAGGAKLADLPGFTVSVRLFAPRRTGPRIARAAATCIAGGEIAAGAVSLSSPRLGWLNLVVLGICGGFFVVSVVGYVRYPHRSCRCFGALSRHSFARPAIARAAGLTIAALLATARAGGPAVQVGPAGRLATLLVGLLVAVAALSAAAAIGAGSDPAAARPGAAKLEAGRPETMSRWA